MTAVQSKKFGWFRKVSAWEQSQAWRQKRRAMVEEFQSNATNLANSLGAAQANQIAGKANLAVQVATTRIEAATKAKLKMLA